MAVFLTLILYQQLHQFKKESAKALILHIIALLFAAQTVNWVLHFLYRMYEKT
jgi:putative effector of murein hydrolase